MISRKSLHNFASYLLITFNFLTHDTSWSSFMNLEKMFLWSSSSSNSKDLGYLRISRKSRYDHFPILKILKYKPNSSYYLQKGKIVENGCIICKSNFVLSFKVFCYFLLKSGNVNYDIEFLILWTLSFICNVMQPQVNWQSSKIFVQTQQDFDEVEPLLRIQPEFSSHH